MDANKLAGIAAAAQDSVITAASEHSGFGWECTTFDLCFLALKCLRMENEDTCAMITVTRLAVFSRLRRLWPFLQ